MEYQYARLNYQHSKLESIRKGVFPEYGGNIEFELFSFFEICYHLKDWIIESPKHCKKDVEYFVTSSPALRICADICNRLKHKVLRHNQTKEILRNKRSLAPLGPFNITQLMSVGPFPDDARVSIPNATIHTERGDECCFSLADECMSEWKRYFSENRML